MSDEAETEQIEARSRAGALRLLKQAEAEITSGRASGIIIVAVGSDGFCGCWRAMPPIAAALAAAVCALDFNSANLHETWSRIAMSEGDPAAPPLVKVPRPEEQTTHDEQYPRDKGKT